MLDAFYSFMHAMYDCFERPVKMKLKILLSVIFSAFPLLVSAQILRNENLSFEIPSDFIEGANLSRAGLTFFEYVPRTESVRNWTKMLTVQVLHGFPARGITGDRFQNLYAEQMRQSCPGSESRQIETGVVNSYNFQLWQNYCPLSSLTRRAEFFISKTIDGADSLYIIQYTFTSAPSEAKISEAKEYLRTIFVCDTRIASRPCSLGRQ